MSKKQIIKLELCNAEPANIAAIQNLKKGIMPNKDISNSLSSPETKHQNHIHSQRGPINHLQANTQVNFDEPTSGRGHNVTPQSEQRPFENQEIVKSFEYQKQSGKVLSNKSQNSVSKILTTQRTNTQGIVGSPLCSNQLSFGSVRHLPNDGKQIVSEPSIGGQNSKLAKKSRPPLIEDSQLKNHQIQAKAKEKKLQQQIQKSVMTNDNFAKAIGTHHNIGDSIISQAYVSSQQPQTLTNQKSIGSSTEEATGGSSQGPRFIEDLSMHWRGMRNEKLLQKLSQLQSISPSSKNAKGSEQYQRPYPGYAFEFHNIDSYTKRRQKIDLSPIRQAPDDMRPQYSLLFKTNRDSIEGDATCDSIGIPSTGTKDSIFKLSQHGISQQQERNSKKSTMVADEIMNKLQSHRESVPAGQDLKSKQLLPVSGVYTFYGPNKPGGSKTARGERADMLAKPGRLSNKVSSNRSSHGDIVNGAQTDSAARFEDGNLKDQMVKLDKQIDEALHQERVQKQHFLSTNTRYLKEHDAKNYDEEYSNLVGDIKSNRLQNLPKIKFKIATNQQELDSLMQSQDQHLSTESANMDLNIGDGFEQSQQLQGDQPFANRFSQSQAIQRRYLVNQVGQSSEDPEKYYPCDEKYGLPDAIMTQKTSKIMQPIYTSRAMPQTTRAHNPGFLQMMQDSVMSSGDGAELLNTKQIQKLRTKVKVPDLLSQQQRFKVNKRHEDYNYVPKDNEMTDDMMGFTGSNKYFEAKNPQVRRQINYIQSNIMPKQKINEVRERQQKMEKIMKDEKKKWMATLLQGEADEHCTGINNRTDRFILIKMKQARDKYEMIRQENLERIQKEKAQKDKDKLQKKRARTQAWLNILDANIPYNMFKKRQENAFIDSFNKNKPQSIYKTKGGPKREIQKGVSHFNVSQEQNRVQIQIDNPGDDEEEDQLKIADTINEDDFDALVPTLKESVGKGAGGEAAQADDEAKDSKLQIAKRGSAVRGASKQFERRGSGQIGAAGATQPGADPKKKGKGHSGKSSTAVGGFNMTKKQQIELIQNKMHLCGLVQENVQQLGMEVLKDEHGVYKKIINYYKCDFQEQMKLQAQKTGGAITSKPKIFQTPSELGLDEDVELREFFISMCEDKDQIKLINMKLDRQQFRTFLHDRYSRFVGDQIIKFLSDRYQPLYSISYTKFLEIIAEFLNDGPERYIQMLFMSMQLTNPGRLCEHDIFTLFEQFKLKDSLLFYTELIGRDDVPRNYNKISDNSDQVFVDAFVKDIKVIAQMMNLKKRMMGLEDMDTVEGIEADFKYHHRDSKDPLSQAEEDDFDEYVLHQIDFILWKIHQRVGQNHGLYSDKIYQILINATSLADIRHNLCKMTAENKILSRNTQQIQKKQSQMSCYSDTKSQQNGAGKAERQSPSGGAKSSALNFWKPSKEVIPCCGVNKERIADCIFITLEEFKRLFSAKRSSQKRLSSLVTDFFRTVTVGKIKLEKFEAEMSQYREPNSEKFKGKYFKPQLNPKISMSPTTQLPMSDKSKALMSVKRTMSKIEDPKAMAKLAGQLLDLNNVGGRKLKFDEVRPKVQEHHKITDMFMITDSQSCGKFEGKLLESKSGHMNIINADAVAALAFYKEHFGPENFFNIFKCFYQLANIPEDAQNNPDELYIDELSMVQGFPVTFGVDYEEIAVRFFNLFAIQPQGKSSAQKIDMEQFYYIATRICDIHHEEQMNLFYAFKFYDYDNDDNIGSVDIVNLLKELPLHKRDSTGLYTDGMSKIDKLFKAHDMAYKARRKQAKEQAGSAIRSQESDCDSPDSPRKGPLGALGERRDERIADTDGDSSDESAEESVKEPASDDEKQTQCSFYSKKSRPESRTSNNGKRRQSNKGTDSQSKMMNKKLKPQAQKVQNKERNHMHARSIFNKWNLCLLEARCLRDFYVNEAVTPAQKVNVPEADFLTKKVFDNQFSKEMTKKYLMEAPAITHFFRDRFICKQSTTQKYGMRNLVDQAAKGTGGSSKQVQSSLTPSNTNKDGHELDFDAVRAEMQWTNASDEFMHMVQALQIISTCRDKALINDHAQNLHPEYYELHGPANAQLLQR